MPTIQITDTRLDDKETKVEPIDVEVEVVETKETTLQIQNDDGTVTSQTLNVVQPPKKTTLKQIDSEINSLQSQIGLMKEELIVRQQMIEEKKALRDEVASEVDKYVIPTVDEKVQL